MRITTYLERIKTFNAKIKYMCQNIIIRAVMFYKAGYVRNEYKNIAFA